MDKCIELTDVYPLGYSIKQPLMEGGGLEKKKKMVDTLAAVHPNPVW